MFFTRSVVPVIGLDTGFFFRLEEADGQAAAIFERIRQGEDEGALATITLFELLRHGLRGSLPQDVVDQIVEYADEAFTLTGTDERAVIVRAARLAHGTGLAMADALIAASLEAVGCDYIYTTDHDFERYAGSMQIVFLDP